MLSHVPLLWDLMQLALFVTLFSFGLFRGLPTASVRPVLARKKMAVFLCFTLQLQLMKHQVIRVIVGMPQMTNDVKPVLIDEP